MTSITRRQGVSEKHEEYGVSTSTLFLFVKHNLIDRDELHPKLQALIDRKEDQTVTEDSSKK